MRERGGIRVGELQEAEEVPFPGLVCSEDGRRWGLHDAGALGAPVEVRRWFWASWGEVSQQKLGRGVAVAGGKTSLGVNSSYGWLGWWLHGETLLSGGNGDGGWCSGVWGRGSGEGKSGIECCGALGASACASWGPGVLQRASHDGGEVAAGGRFGVRGRARKLQREG